MVVSAMTVKQILRKHQLGPAGKQRGRTKLTVGGFVDASANVNHFAFTRDEETTIVLHGEGPVEFNYVNPNDDPRNHPNAVKPQ